MKSILVHLNGSPADVAALNAAWRVGRSFAAHLDCLRVVPTLADLATATLRVDEDSRGAAEALELQRIVVSKTTERASRHFLELCRRENLAPVRIPPADKASAAWQERNGRDTDVVIGEARTHDLVVLGAFGPDRLPPDALGRIIFESGKPLLLAPPDCPTDPIHTVAIAWKDTTEAARAVTAAMPILSKARRVFVLIANEDNRAALECVNCSENLVTQLRWHGLTAEARYVLPAGRTPPVAVMETAREADADLLVMGAYGRSRWRETIFGGFTREVLEGPSRLLVLLTH